jgi:hypothetical protein
MITFILAFLFTVFQTRPIEARGLVLASASLVSLALAGCVWTEKRFFWNQEVARMGTKVQLLIARIRRYLAGWGGPPEKELEGATINIV